MKTVKQSATTSKRATTKTAAPKAAESGLRLAPASSAPRTEPREYSGLTGPELLREYADEIRGELDELHGAYLRFHRNVPSTSLDDVANKRIRSAIVEIGEYLAYMRSEADALESREEGMTEGRAHTSR